MLIRILFIRITNNNTKLHPPCDGGVTMAKLFWCGELKQCDGFSNSP